MKTEDTALRKILVVEDEPSIGEVCQDVLAGEGFEVDVASNGKVAQNMVGRAKYDVCLIDIRMPEMDGEEFYHWLEVDFPRMAHRAIFTTGDVINRNVMAFIEQSARPILEKPFTIDQLRAVIKETLNEAENWKA